MPKSTSGTTNDPAADSATHPTRQATLDWLMQGDPAIRWQTLRDLLDAPAEQWQAEQARTLETGWGAALLEKQEPDGRWGGGIYSPKWISTTYTLLLLRDLGLPRTCPAAQRGARLVLDGLLGQQYGKQFLRRLAQCDRCIVGMILSLAIYFQVSGSADDDHRVDAIIENVLGEVMADGAWNCRKDRQPFPKHSSFHTTLNVLDGVRDVLDLCPGRYHDELVRVEQSALELLLQHKLMRSDKTGALINSKFTLFAFPHYWHYDAFRGLSYLARANAPRDARAAEAIERLRALQRPDGRWPVQNRYSGKVYFHMETLSAPSRWNTLRALRISRWWESA